MAMISSITSLSLPPFGSPGTRKSCAICPIGGCAARKIGTSAKLPATSTIMNRSKRRKLPVEAAAMVTAAAAITPQPLGIPRYCRPSVTPMNSVTMVSAFSRKRSMIEKAPQNFPNRWKIRRAWPTPVTTPSRTTISWFT